MAPFSRFLKSLQRSADERPSPARFRVPLLKCECQRASFHNSESVLSIPHAAARNGPRAEDRAFAPEICTLARAERHPMPDELLDPYRHPEEMLQNRSQAIGVPLMANQRADVKEFREVGHRIAAAEHLGPHPEKGAEVDGEPEPAAGSAS